MQRVAFTQEFEIKSFRKDASDISAVKYGRKDVNNQNCAIIKVRTNLSDLRFDCNLKVTGNVEVKPDEVWLYVSPKEKRLKFMKEGFISLDYSIPIPVEASYVYILELVNKFQEIIKPGATIGFIYIKSTPEGADVILNDKPTGMKTPYQLALQKGQYNYELKLDLYMSHKGSFTISDGKKDTLNTELILSNNEIMSEMEISANRDWWTQLSMAWQEVFCQQLNIQRNPDNTQIQQLTRLTKVVIHENFQIYDLECLKALPRLVELEFSGTAVCKLDPLSKMTKLQSLICRNNPINDLSPLISLHNMRLLDCSYTLVENLEPLQNLLNLEILKFSGTQVKNLVPLKKLVNMKVLDFSNTKVDDVNILDGMQRLQSAKLFNTKVPAKRAEKLKMIHPACEIIFY